MNRDITVYVRVEDEGGFLSEIYHQTVLRIVIKPFNGVNGAGGVSVHLGRLRMKVDFMTAFDNIPEEDGLTTFTLLNGEGYEVDESKKVAKTFVLDDDDNFAPGNEVDVSFVTSPNNQTVRPGENVSIYAVTSKDALLEYRITILKQDGRELVYNRKRRVSRIIGNNRITRWSPSFRESYLQPDNTYYDYSYFNEVSFTIKITAINGTEVDGEELVLEVGELPRINTTESEVTDDQVEVETVAVDLEETPSEDSEESDTEKSVTDMPETDEKESQVTSLPIFSVFAETDAIEPDSNPVYFHMADRLNINYILHRYSYELESEVIVPLQYYEESVPSGFNLKLPRFAEKYAKKLTPDFRFLHDRERIQKFHVEIVELDTYEVNQSYKRASVSVAIPDSAENGDSSSGVVPDSSTTVTADVSPALPEIDISTNRDSGEPVREGEIVKIIFTASAKPTGPLYVRYIYDNAGKEIFIDKKKFSPGDFVRQSRHGEEVYVATSV